MALKLVLKGNFMYPEKITLSLLYPNVMFMKDGRPFHLPFIKEGYRGEWVIDVPLQNGNEIIKWCKEILGEPGRNRKYRWRMNYAARNRIYLRNQNDVLMFRLRWL